jgi:YidC/Oxa1 family membrane protein insertase
MRKTLSNKKFWLVLCLIGLAVLTGCQRNVDPTGKTLPERIIYLNTPWSAMFNESILSAILVYPLAQCINLIGKALNSGVAGVAITTILYNVLTLGLSIKSTVSTQKMQMLQPEINRIQAKYEGRTDENARLQMAQEQQALFNKHKINPLASIGTMFLTFPIMFAMLYAAQRADVVCNGSFLGVSLATTPSEAFKNIATQWPIVLIFVVMIIGQLVSSLLPQFLAKKKQRESKGYKKYDDKGMGNSQQNVMMISMIVMVAIFGLNWPSAMSVYWAVSSLANVAKTLFIQWRYIDNAAV